MRAARVARGPLVESIHGGVRTKSAPIFSGCKPLPQVGCPQTSEEVFWSEAPGRFPAAVAERLWSTPKRWKDGHSGIRRCGGRDHVAVGY